MTTHTCLRCGLESHCPHGGWADRHPFAAVVFAVPMALFVLGAVCAYPWLLAVIVVSVLAYVIDRGHSRRQALAARADWEHHRLMARGYPPEYLDPYRIRATGHSAQVTAVTDPGASGPTEPIHSGRYL